MINNIVKVCLHKKGYFNNYSMIYYNFCLCKKSDF